jgi:hypothetical protein
MKYQNWIGHVSDRGESLVCLSEIQQKMADSDLIGLSTIPNLMGSVNRAADHNSNRIMMRRLISAGLILTTAGCRPAESKPLPVDFDIGLSRSIPRMSSVDDTTFFRPVGLAIHRNFLAVLDESGPTIRIITPDGELERVVAGKGDGPGELRDPRDISVASDGRIAVSDARSLRLSVFSRDGDLLESIPLGDGKVGSIVFDSQGNLHVDRRGSVKPSGRLDAATVEVLGPSRSIVRRYGAYRPLDDPIGEALENESRLAAAKPDGVWKLSPYRGLLERIDSLGKTIVTVRLTVPEGYMLDGPYTEMENGNPYIRSIIRQPIA